MIKGIGVDLTDKHRFEILIEKYGNKIATKLLSSKEFNEYDNSNNKASFLSKDLLLKKHYQKHLDMVYIDMVFIQSELRLDMTLMENHFFHFQKRC